uniref:PIH1 N-terminal domain-containing protein n=1 Tax=Meloidogyne incognita TaxID=6306 RepID=A0A914MIL4_MELIC
MSGKKLVEIIDKQKHKKDDETWTVHPTPGICVKFKKNSESNFKHPLITNEDIRDPTPSNKFFINLAHCIEIPSPPKELWKDEEIIAKMMENDKNSFKIPMCVGEVENVEDHNGNISTKDSESNFKRPLITNEDIGVPTSSNKFFINLAHCIEIPSPPKDLWKDEEIIAKMMENDKNSFKIPMCVGEVENVEDHNGNISTKVDVIVNSKYFEKCIENSEFFRQITLAAICEKLKQNYSININLSNQIILRNKKYIGELNIRQIQKRPLNSILDDNNSKTKNKILIKEENLINNELIDIDDIEETRPKKPRNFKVQILNGEFMDIKIKVKDSDGQLVREKERITLKMNDDRVVAHLALLDSSSVIADFFLPFLIEIDETTNCEFDLNSSTIFIKCKINFDCDKEV